MGQIQAALKELCEILEIEKKAPVHYVDKENVKKQNSIVCRCVPDALAEDVDNDTFDSQKVYDRSECGLYIPELTADALIELHKRGNPGSVKMIMSSVNKVYISEYNLTYAVFCILHELGHWVHYNSTDLSDKEFYCKEKADRWDAEQLRKEIYKMPDYNPIKLSLCDKQNEMYRNIPSEKAADQYALKHLEEAMECVRNSFQYTVEDLIQGRI